MPHRLTPSGHVLALLALVVGSSLASRALGHLELAGLPGLLFGLVCLVVALVGGLALIASLRLAPPPPVEKPDVVA